MPHVFISYSRKDTEFVEKLERDLNARGISIWRDTSSIVGGEEWYQAIMRGIQQSYVMLQVVTPNSEDSKWVRREGLYADQRDLPIIPVLPEPHPIPFHLIETQPVVCENYAEGFARLIAALKLLADAAPVAPVSTAGTVTDPRELELAYLDFLLGELQADLKSAHYVDLLAEQQRAPKTAGSAPKSIFGNDFSLTFDRLVDMEHVRGEQFDQPGDLIPDARLPLREMGRVILLGEPGAGKTTTLQQLAIDMARGAKDNPTAPLPVFVPLRSYQGTEPFADFVRGWLFTLQSQYDRLLTGRRLVLLLDALNEMQRHANGRDLIAEVRGYLRDKQPWIVSCRVRDYQEELKDLRDVGKVRLKPLDLPRIKQVIDRYFSADGEKAAALWTAMYGNEYLLAAWEAFEEKGKADNFWKPQNPDNVELGASWRNSIPYYAWDIMHHGKGRMMLLCRNPFMLFMVCKTFERVGQLPRNQGALFALFADNLLKREEDNSRTTRRAWIDTDIIRRALAQLANAMQQYEAGTEITRTEAERILHNLPNIDDPALLLRLASAARLLDVGDTIRFTHQLLQEYFASEIMGGAMDGECLATDFWPPEEWWVPQGWEETAIILAGVCGDPEGVARWIAPAQPEIAYQVLTECGIDLDLDALEPETRAALVSSARDKIGEANPVGRAAAYRVLALMDADDRAGIGLRDDGLPDIDWVEIPVGEFIYQDNTRLMLPTFYISRYPITYAQFQAFIDDPEGFHEKRWWDGLALPKGRNDMPEDQWFKFWNHPRECVSWYDAVAFCRWLSWRLDGGWDLDAVEKWAVRLPTEFEWEKAARGTDGRMYPYGNTFDAAQGNTSETGIRQTSAVGMFSQGASPYGVLDMHGNVWQWCLTDYSAPASDAMREDLRNGAQRVVRGGSWRGGSWRGDQGFSRACSRGYFDPYDWRNNRGFRLVRPPSL